MPGVRLRRKRTGIFFSKGPATKEGPIVSVELHDVLKYKPYVVIIIRFQGCASPVVEKGRLEVCRILIEDFATLSKDSVTVKIDAASKVSRPIITRIAATEVTMENYLVGHDFKILTVLVV